MKNPFKVGDVVYHPQFGKTQAVEVDTGCVKVQTEDNRRDWADIDLLSFKPWTTPCHERPIEDGWWLVSCGGGEVKLRHKRGDAITNSEGSRVGAIQHGYTFHRYLGKDWK